MKRKMFAALCAAACAASALASPKIDTSNDRVKAKLGNVPYEMLGVLVPKNVSQVKTALTIGGETLDRDYADYDAYKEYLIPLGFKKIRLQGGWAKTEKVKGVYDFAWLDHIVDDANSRGIIPWVQTSYGNPIYDGGGTPFLSGGMPMSEEGKAAWDRWVTELAKRYAGKVEWEMWNEPENNRKHTDDIIVENNVRTAKIILKYDPKGKIAALSLASIRVERFDSLIKKLSESGMLEKFEWVTYHGYTPRPEDAYSGDPNRSVDKMLEILAKYRKGSKPTLRQGENGCPSKGFLGGALSKFPWTEYSQAKWDLRRMMGDWGRGIETSVFSISDMRYAATDAIKIVNVKGLLGTDEKNRVVKIKPAYYAAQNLASIIDILDIQRGKFAASETFAEQIDAFAYSDKETGLPVFTLWFVDGRPSNNYMAIPVDITLKGGAAIKDPVWVDVLTGRVFQIPASAVSREGGDLKVKNMPVYDSPVMVSDKSLVDFKK